MILLLIYYVQSRVIYDLQSTRPESMILFLNQFESVDVMLPNESLTLISKWHHHKDLLLEVETEDKNKQIANYGPFDKDSRLVGIYMETVNYSIKFENKGQNNISIAMQFKFYGYNNYMLSSSGFSDEYEFVEYKYFDDLKLTNFTYDDKAFDFVNGLYVLIIALLCLDIIISFAWSSMCCCCCHYNEED